VVVIAQGSGTGTVDLDILNAVQVLFDVPAHKIKIMKMK
jgi:stage III sporulation protein AG